MPFEIVRNDIVKMQVDAVVNSANPHPVVGTGVDTAIHNAAGPELLKAREEIGDTTSRSVRPSPRQPSTCPRSTSSTWSARPGSTRTRWKKRC